MMRILRVLMANKHDNIQILYVQCIDGIFEKYWTAMQIRQSQVQTKINPFVHVNSNRIFSPQTSQCGCQQVSKSRTREASGTCLTDCNLRQLPIP